MKQISVYGKGNDGHRLEYYTVFTSEFASMNLDIDFIATPAAVLSAESIFFSMIEENVILFTIVALSTIITRHNVVGLLFRVGECIRPNLKHKVKYALFSVLRRLPRVRVLTIMPFFVEPRFAEVANDWIYDPQLWDLETLGTPHLDDQTPLSNEVRELASGRRILVALGGQNRGKGFDYLAQIWQANAEFREEFLVVAAGTVSSESTASADILRHSGAAVFDRFLSTAEMRSLYSVCDLVWGTYHPDYDQASGIVGRAFQLGVPAVLRRGSLMARLMEAEGGEVVEINFDDPTVAAVALCAYSPRCDGREPPIAVRQAMRRRSLQVLSTALGYAPEERP